MKLTLSDGKTTLSLPLAPENLTESTSGEFARNAVLDTAANYVRPKGSTTSLTFSKLLLISGGFVTNQQPTIKQLQLWAKAQTRLVVSYNTVRVPYAYLQSLKVDYIQWREGKPVHATIDLEVIETLPDIKPKKTINPKKITPREQQKKKKDIEGKLKKIAPKLGLQGNVSVEVDDLQQVLLTSLSGTDVYDYDELVGDVT